MNQTQHLCFLLLQNFIKTYVLSGENVTVIVTVSLPENVTSVSDLVLLNSKGTTLTNSKLQKYSGHKQGVYYCNVIIPPEVRHYKYFKIVVYMYIKVHEISKEILNWIYLTPEKCLVTCKFLVVDKRHIVLSDIHVFYFIS